MSVQTGIAPQAILALDGEMFEALVSAADERWPMELELQAMTVELLSAQLLAFLRVHGNGRRSLPDPLTIARPQRARREDDGPERGPRLSVAELARLPGLTAELTEATS
ncbi:MAG TPA: hypothetical protein VH834_18050 [Solirubrobacteraceae bacterium]